MVAGGGDGQTTSRIDQLRVRRRASTVRDVHGELVAESRSTARLSETLRRHPAVEATGTRHRRYDELQTGVAGDVHIEGRRTCCGQTSEAVFDS